MKRSFSEIAEVQIIPNEIIVEILLETFSYRIRTREQWHNLHSLFTKLIELRHWKRAPIYSRIKYICPEVMKTRHFPILKQFKFLEKISLYPLPREARSWEEILSTLPMVKNINYTKMSAAMPLILLSSVEKLSICQSSEFVNLENFTNLKKLRASLWNRNIPEFPPLTNLTYLHVKNFFINQDKDILKPLVNLRSLFLESCCGPIFLDDSLEHLTTISISDSKVDFDTFQLENLNTLKLAKSTIHLDWTRLGNLKKLGIHDITGITTENLKYLTSLTSLALIGGCTATKLDLPLDSLTELNINRSHLRPCPENYPNLKSLHLADNKAVFNYQLREMTNLTHLDLRDNPRLNSDCLQTLEKLKRLDLSARSIVTSNKLIGFTNLTNLTHITTEDRHEFFIQGLYIERHPPEYYKRRMRKLKFFLDD